MKKIYILCIGAILMQTTNAQITLTASNHTPQVGNTLGMHEDYINSGDVEYNFNDIEGANQTWDFSSMDINVVSDVEFFYIAPENDYFPGTSIVLSLPNFSSEYKNDYMVASNEALSVVGQHNFLADEKHIYSDGFDLLRYPMNYGDTYVDDVDGIIDYAATVDWAKTGTVTVTADAYGDLILPYGTISNVLRVETITDYEIGLASLPQREHRYDWYHEGSNIPIVTCRKININDEGVDFPWKIFAIDEAAIQTLSVSEESTLLNNLYPNPASNFVKLPADAEWSKLYDINGRLVKALTISQQQIDTSDIKTGMYFVSFGIGDQVYRKKIVIQH